MPYVFPGMRGTGNWSADERPKNYREGILRLYPNGSAPLTALLSKMKSEKLDDSEFTWWSKRLAQQQYEGTAGSFCYTDSGLSDAHTGGDAAEDVVPLNAGGGATAVYLKMPAANAKEFRLGHVVMVYAKATPATKFIAKVTAEPVINGDSSYLTVKALQKQGVTTSILAAVPAACDSILCIGNANPEGGIMPAAIAYDPYKFRNYTQIFRTPLSITRTASKTRLRTASSRAEAKREALEIHSIEMEKAFFWGVPSELTTLQTGVAAGQIERTTGGVIHAIQESGGVISNYADDSGATFDGATISQSDLGAYGGQAWTTGGETWLNNCLEMCFRMGAHEKVAFCGNGAILGIQKLVAAGVDYQFSKDKVYGYNVTQWVTPFGVVNLLTHPLFSQSPLLQNSMVIMDTSGLRYRFIDDTTFYGEGEKQNTGAGRIDGYNEEFLTEAGLEFHHAVSWAHLSGIGKANA